MNQAMRQRLLGILVLVALASILMPLLLDFRTGEKVDTRTRLPPAPQIQPVPLPQLDQPGQSPPPAQQSGTEAQQFDAEAQQPGTEAPPEARALPEESAVAAAAAPEPPKPAEPNSQSQSSKPQPQPQPQAKPAPFALPEADPRSAQSRTAAVPREPGLDAKGMPRAWVLQLGVFTQEQNALDLRNRLVAGGHRAFVQAAKAGQPRAYRVFVGPKMTRAQLFAEQRELERKFKIKPMVVPFAP